MQRRRVAKRRLPSCRSTGLHRWPVRARCNMKVQAHRRLAGVADAKRALQWRLAWHSSSW
jgi:hypothetical protein